MYKRGVWVMGGLLMAILVAGMFTTVHGRSWFMEHPRVMLTIAGLVLLLGVHVLVFSKQYVEDLMQARERFLRHAPPILKGFSLFWSRSRYRVFMIIAGLYCLLWAILFGFFTLTRK